MGSVRPYCTANPDHRLLAAVRRKLHFQTLHGTPRPRIERFLGATRWLCCWLCSGCVRRGTRIAPALFESCRGYAEKRAGAQVRPVFITLDPERDSASLIKEYVKEFHSRMVGLWGTVDEVKAAAKAYRVYYMKTNDSPTDYLVDHSIIMVRLQQQQQQHVA